MRTVFSIEGIELDDRTRVIINAIVIFSLTITFLFTFLYPILTSKDWDENDMDVRRDGYLMKEIRLPVRGKLEVNAYTSYLGDWDPFDTDWNEEYEVEVRLRSDNGEIELEEGGGFLESDSFDIPGRGVYTLTCTNSGGHDIEVSVSFTAWGTRICCSFSCIIIPLFAIIYAIIALITSSKRKKIMNGKTEEETSIKEEETTGDHYGTGW